MGSSAEENEEANQLDVGKGFAGPKTDRKCTDVLWLLLLLAHWFSVTYLAFVAFGWIESKKITRLPEGDETPNKGHLYEVAACNARKADSKGECTEPCPNDRVHRCCVWTGRGPCNGTHPACGHRGQVKSGKGGKGKRRGK